MDEFGSVISEIRKSRCKLHATEPHRLHVAFIVVHREMISDLHSRLYTGSIKDGPYWTFKKNILELIELLLQ